MRNAHPMALSGRIHQRSELERYFVFCTIGGTERTKAFFHWSGCQHARSSKIWMSRTDTRRKSSTRMHIPHMTQKKTPSFSHPLGSLMRMTTQIVMLSAMIVMSLKITTLALALENPMIRIWATRSEEHTSELQS